jgi:DNA-binding ferritin-like protein
MALCDMYKKHHWQMSGAIFYQLHLLLDTHYEAQAVLVDMIAERIMALGGISIAMAADVAELTEIPRPPKGREDLQTQLARLLEAHEIILRQAHEGPDEADEADDSDDDGTNNLLVKQCHSDERGTGVVDRRASRRNDPQRPREMMSRAPCFMDAALVERSRDGFSCRDWRPVPPYWC